MSYTIGHVVFGLDLTQHSYRPVHEAVDGIMNIGDDVLEDLIENGITGFESAYSGNGDSPQWFGIEVYKFDECHPVDVEQLKTKLTVTDELKARYNELMNDLHGNLEHPDVEFIIRAYEPEMMILWGSS